MRVPYVRAHRDDLGEVLGDQAEVITSVFQQGGGTAKELVDRERWNRVLADRMFVRNKLTATDFGRELADEFGSRFDPEQLDAFLLVNADLGADSINGATEAALQRALDEDDADEAVAAMFAVLLSSKLDSYAESTVTTSSNFGMTSSAEQAGVAEKVWRVTSKNPRAAHAAMNGERAPIAEPFSNGMAWPGDPSGGADNLADCRCSVEFERDA